MSHKLDLGWLCVTIKKLYICLSDISYITTTLLLYCLALFFLCSTKPTRLYYFYFSTTNVQSCIYSLWICWLGDTLVMIVNMICLMLQGHHLKLFVTYAVQHTLGSQVGPQYQYSLLNVECTAHCNCSVVSGRMYMYVVMVFFSQM